MASVASELDFNKENVSVGSIDMSSEAAMKLRANSTSPMDYVEQTGINLRQNFNMLAAKHVKLLDNMTMEDVGF